MMTMQCQVIKMIETLTMIPLFPDLGGSDPELKKVEGEKDKDKEKEKKDLGDLGHCRNLSHGSQLSKASGYSSSYTGTHSRQSSYGSATGHTR